MGAFEDGAPAAVSRSARLLRWSSVALLGVQIPVGLFMVRNGAATDFAAPSGILYDGHELLGLLILLVAAVRLAYRLAHGAPRCEPSLAAWQKTLSHVTHHVTHWAIYAMLFAVPLLAGWRFPSRDRSGHSALRFRCSPPRTATGQNASLPIIASPPTR